MNILENTNGHILLVSMLVMISFTLILAIGVSLTAIDNLNISATYLDGQDAEKLSEACLEETLIQLKWNPSYSGGNINLNDGSCQISVSINGQSRNVQVSGELGSYTSEISADVDLSVSPYQISNWTKGF